MCGRDFRNHPKRCQECPSHVAQCHQLCGSVRSSSAFSCFVASGCPSLHSCRCGRPLDALGHHRAALGRTDGLPLFHGAQLAVDATMVSTETQSAIVDGAALARARQRKEATYPVLAGRFVAPVWSCWLLKWEEGGQRRCQDFLPKVRGAALDRRGCGAGVVSWLAAQREVSLFPSWNDGWRWGLTAQPHLPCLSLWLSEAWWLGLRVTVRILSFCKERPKPVESRIKSSEFFIERAKKRVQNARKEVEVRRPRLSGTDRLGQSVFGHPDLANLGQSIFAQSVWPIWCVS